MGFASGLPLLLIGSTLQAWMTDSGVSLANIGFFSLVGLPYTVKFLWSPLLDRYTPLMGKRKGWIMIFQFLLFVLFGMISFLNPQTNLPLFAFAAFIIALFSASQDIVIDSYRREILADEELGFGSALYVNGYRVAMIVGGALALYLADQIPWMLVYQIMAFLMLASVLLTFFAPLEDNIETKPLSLKEAVIGPFLEFFKRDGAWLFLIFILLYKMGDTMASHMTTPFILELGYSKTDMATIAKGLGMGATIIGATFGGMFIIKMGIMRSLWVFGFFQAISTAGFSLLYFMPVKLSSLGLVITFENLSAGLGTSAYAAYMASLTNKKFTATQYALLTSLMGIPRVIAAAPTGILVETIGWVSFFIVCTLIAVPGMMLIPILRTRSS